MFEDADDGDELSDLVDEIQLGLLAHDALHGHLDELVNLWTNADRPERYRAALHVHSAHVDRAETSFQIYEASRQQIDDAVGPAEFALVFECPDARVLHPQKLREAYTENLHEVAEIVRGVDLK